MTREQIVPELPTLAIDLDQEAAIISFKPEY
jgi:hypothetical protein